VALCFMCCPWRAGYSLGVLCEARWVAGILKRSALCLFGSICAQSVAKSTICTSDVGNNITASRGPIVHYGMVAITCRLSRTDTKIIFTVGRTSVLCIGGPYISHSVFVGFAVRTEYLTLYRGQYPAPRTVYIILRTTAGGRGH
jgi:hypothetical protein